MKGRAKRIKNETILPLSKTGLDMVKTAESRAYSAVLAMSFYALSVSDYLNRPDNRPKKRTSSKHQSQGESYLACVYKGYPSQEQKELFWQSFGCCRWYWNYLVSCYRSQKKPKTESQLKQENAWLRIPHSLALCNVKLNFQGAVSDYEAGTKGRPKYKKKGLCRKAFTANNQKDEVRIENGCLLVPPSGFVPIENFREMPEGGKIKSCTVSQEPDGQWLFSVLFEYLPTEWVENPQIKAFLESGCAEDIRIIGLDMSLPKLYVDSNGSEPWYQLDNNTGTHIIRFERQYHKLEYRVAREQRKLSHMKKRSNNYQKQCNRIARLHAKAKHQRHDFLRQMASRLAKSYAMIGIEDLDMSAMKRSLKFGKSVSDNGWGYFTRYLEEACAKTGSFLLRVGKWLPSSKTCSHCGYVHKELKLKDRTYICPKCGHVMDRDWQAAVNIRDEAFREFLGIAQVINTKASAAA